MQVRFQVVESNCHSFDSEAETLHLEDCDLNLVVCEEGFNDFF